MSAKLIDNYGLSGTEKFVCHAALDQLEEEYASVRITVNPDKSGEVRASHGIPTSLTSVTIICEWSKDDDIITTLNPGW